jgi:hypothetical protein
VYVSTFQLQWSHGLRCRSAAARLLILRVWIPLAAWMFICCKCCVLEGRGLCDELITRPEESYQLWCVIVRYLETSRLQKPWSMLGSSTMWRGISAYLVCLGLVLYEDTDVIYSHIGQLKILNSFWTTKCECAIAFQNTMDTESFFNV